VTSSNHPSSGLAIKPFIRNIGWNLIGQVAPLAAALVSIPLLIKAIGTDRFGILSIGWMLIGYFSLFDFGLGRALTQILSEKLATRNEEQVPALMWTGLTLMFALGLGASAALFAMSDWIIYSALKIPEHLQAEARQSFFMLVPSIPFVVLATGLRGVLEAKQAFKLVNLVRTPLGVLTFVGPLLALPFSNSLVPIFFILMVVRLLTTLFFVIACDRAIDNFWRFEFSKNVIPALLRFSGWMTVSNIVGPIMVNMDRFIIGAVLSISAVTYYTTPFEIIVRLLTVPGAVAGVCFPMFAEHAKNMNVEKLREILWRSSKYVFCLMLFAAGIMFVFAEDILRIWLNEAFARNSATVLKILSVGILINGVAHIPFSFIQGMGESKVTAQFHLFELAVYLPVLYVAIHAYGIIGVAVAWCIRGTLDAYLLFSYSHKKLTNFPATIATDMR